MVSSKVRLYDLAKELKLDARRLIEEVRREGVDVSVPSNSISTELAEKIRYEYALKKETKVLRRVKVVRRARSAEEAATGKEAPAGESEAGPAAAMANDADDVELLRAPVVTVMGHLGHGKTSLLDAVRATEVAANEAGRIIQNIDAYNVWVPSPDDPTEIRRVVFLDSEAFTMMRAHGAEVADVVVLVVAADHGVMPQTIEAINHSRAANVPIVVAISKIDEPAANPDRVKQDLANLGLTPVEWGGETEMVLVSARKRQNLDVLIDAILLTCDILNLRASRTSAASGVVLKGNGPVGTVLVQQGTLRIHDPFVVGQSFQTVLAMWNDRGEPVTEAAPATLVQVLGLVGLPGETFHVLADVAQARTAREQMAPQNKAGQPNENFVIASEEGESRLASDIDFEQLLEQFEQEQAVLQEGEVVRGTIVGISEDGIVIDFGYKSEGIVNPAEFTENGALTVRLGDEVEVLVKSLETADGPPILSRVDAVRMKAWDVLEKAYRERTNVKGRVTERIKGGLRVDVEGIAAFLPSSEFDIRQVHNLDSLCGQEIEARVIKLNRKSANFVISCKAADTDVRETYLVDGSNVCFWHGRCTLAILLTLLVELRKRGESFICYFDAKTRHDLESDSKIYEGLLKNHPECFSQAPKGRRADDFLLKRSNSSGMKIISNDAYQKYYEKYAWLKDEPDRLVRGMMAGKVLTIIDTEPNIEIPVNFNLAELVRELEEWLRP